MKKILIVLIINLLWCNIGYSKDINLKCINEESIDEIRELRIKFNKKIVEVNDGKNLLEFKVNDYNQEQVLTMWRGLEKGNTSYDTHVINWNKWDNKKYKKIAVFYQNDSYGRSGLKGVKAALITDKKWNNGNYSNIKIF